jgi:uroporphyrinogen-III synthase
MLDKKAECVCFEVYKNSLPKTINTDYLNKITSNKYDAIIVTSPSSFNNLLLALEGKIAPKELRLFSIGTTTTTEIEIQGIQALSTAKMSNAIGISEAIIEHFTTK